MDQNENPDGVSKWLYDEAMKKVSPEFLAIYPEETIPTTKYAHLFGLQKENVTFTDGSVVGMGYIIKTFGEPGKDILSVTPSFAMHEVYAKMIGMNVKEFEYEKDFSYKVEKTLDNINENTSIVVLVNPNMPIGNVYNKDEIINIVEKAKENDAIVIIDEAYYYFNDKTSIDLIGQYDNVFILHTFSKMLSNPSLRIGAIMSTPENIRCINNYKPPYTVNSIALLFAEAIADNYEKVISELTESYLEGKEYILKALKDNEYEMLPSEGCYVAIKPKFYS